MVDGVKLAILHIDTSFLAHGIYENDGDDYIKSYFDKKGWTIEKVMSKIGQLLSKNKIRNAKYRIAIGHH